MEDVEGDSKDNLWVSEKVQYTLRDKESQIIAGLKKKK